MKIELFIPLRATLRYGLHHYFRARNKNRALKFH